MIARCPKCNSIWVCWNWIHSFGGDFEAYVKANPHMTREELKQTQWGHECWNCGDEYGGYCFETENKVTNGVPYWILTHFSKYFVKE